MTQPSQPNLVHAQSTEELRGLTISGPQSTAEHDEGSASVPTEQLQLIVGGVGVVVVVVVVVEDGDDDDDDDDVVVVVVVDDAKLSWQNEGLPCMLSERKAGSSARQSRTSPSVSSQRT